MTHIRFDGYRVKNKGIYTGGGIYCGHGYLCKANSNSDTDRFVVIYFIQNKGYYYVD